MRNNGNTQDRPEELLAYEIIKTHLKGLVNIDKQKIIMFNDINYAKLDVEFSVRSGQKYAIRLQGPPHGKDDKAINHDRMQELYLIDKGYIVIDFWYKKMEYLWLRNQKKLDEPELRMAFLEVKTKLKQFGLPFKEYDGTIINQDTLTREHNKQT